jgi:hypothetical protein
MGVIVRPRFGRPCYDGCGAIVPTPRLDILRRRCEAEHRPLLPMDRICVDCERKRLGEATVTRRPR